MADENPFVEALEGALEGGGSGGSSSGGGGSSGGGPPTDTYISDIYKQDAVAREKAAAFAQAYMELWGEPATEAYLMKAVNAGLNTWEFAAQERAKPEWANTPAYKQTAGSLAGALGQWVI